MEGLMSDIMPGLKVGYLPKIIDDSIMKTMMGKSEKVLEKSAFWHKDKDFLNEDGIDISNEISFIIQICESFLISNEIIFNKNVWYMDLIRYNLTNEKNVDSGLCWHNENVNYSFPSISLLIYLRKDKTIQGGDLRYKDSKREKKKIAISACNDNCTIIIMDGNIYHKPEDCSGFGKRELINVSFEKN